MNIFAIFEWHCLCQSYEKRIKFFFYSNVKLKSLSEIRVKAELGVHSLEVEKGKRRCIMFEILYISSFYTFNFIFL